MLRPEFALKRFGRGYRRDEVDAFVVRLLATANRQRPARPVTHDELQRVQFRTTFGQPGYDVEQVDVFLHQAEGWLPADDGPGDAPAGAHSSARPGQGAGFERPRFGLARFREGYDALEVDAFVERIMATVEGRPVDLPVTAEEVRDISFTPVRIREGYDVEEVDAFLDLAQRWLAGP